MSMRVIAFDPGLGTGWAVVGLEDERPRLEAAGALTIGAAPSRVKALLLCPGDVVAEGWENQGKSVDIASSYPNRVLGMIEALACDRGRAFYEAKASVWKPQFARNGGYLPAPDRFDSSHQPLANALLHELGYWPAALAAAPRKERRHALDAAALGVWWLLWGSNG